MIKTFIVERRIDEQMLIQCKSEDDYEDIVKRSLRSEMSETLMPLLLEGRPIVVRMKETKRKTLEHPFPAFIFTLYTEVIDVDNVTLADMRTQSIPFANAIIAMLRTIYGQIWKN